MRTFKFTHQLNIFALRFGWSALLFLALSICQQINAAEKQVTFYPTYGYLSGDSWRIPLRIRIVEKSDGVSRLAGKGIREIIEHKAGIEQLTDEEKSIFATRAEGFLADNESRESVSFVFDGDTETQPFQLQKDGKPIKSDRNGNLQGELTLSKSKADALLKAQQSQKGWLSFHTTSQKQSGQGWVQLIPANGISVISDIDDTIKVTEIPSGEKIVLTRTFFQPFEAVPHMAEMYRAFPEEVTFHYISGGPWQLYSPLAEFLFSTDKPFPKGSVHMKNVRLNPFESESYEDIGKLISDGSQAVTYAQKIDQISRLFESFPQRQFILIGDSGEKDPEVYREIQKRFPKQVKEIRIRDLVKDEICNPSRLQSMRVIEVADAANTQCNVLSLN